MQFNSTCIRAHGAGLALGLILALIATPTLDTLVGLGMANADPAGTTTITVADFNGDGLEDQFLQRDVAGSDAYVRIGTSVGQFATEQTLVAGLFGIDWSTNSTRVAIGDFNGDGRQDLFVQATAFGTPHRILFADAHGRFNAVDLTLAADHLGFAWSGDAARIVPGDFDGDGRAEIILQGNDSASLFYVIVESRGNRLAAHGQGWLEDYLGRRWAAEGTEIHVGDFDGDRREDLLLAPIATARPGHPGDAEFALLLSNDDGRFDEVSATWHEDWKGAEWDPSTHRLQVWDVDGDGIKDLWLQSRNRGGKDYLAPRTT